MVIVHFKTSHAFDNNNVTQRSSSARLAQGSRFKEVVARQCSSEAVYCEQFEPQTK